ncbi:MAG TPA: hypothetical protein VL088_07835, partial [Pedobacter sp.]|nr:hypothetical protein [Pedobacter sp.]
MKKKAIKLLLLFLCCALNSAVGYSQTTTPIFLFNNQVKVIPLKGLAERKIASINFGSMHARVFDSLLSKYASIQSFESAAYRTDSLH